MPAATLTPTRTLSIDLETRTPLDLGSVGATRSAKAPGAAILMVGTAWDDEPATVTDTHSTGAPPDWLRQALTDPTVLKRAWNAAFERAYIQHVWGIDCPPEQWRCTMVEAMAASLPASLDMCANALGLPDRKDPRGKALMRKFSIYTKQGKIKEPEDLPTEYDEYMNYCRLDVEAERGIYRYLRAHKLLMPQAEWAVWALDQRINDRGVPLDRPLIESVLSLDEHMRAKLIARASALTGLDNPNSRDQVLQWVRGQGVPMEKLTKADVQAALADESLPGTVREVLRIRTQLARSSVAKFSTLHDYMAPEDDRARGCFQFAGARTGRWAGRGPQFHNLGRGIANPKALENLRTTVLTRDPDLLEIQYGDPADALANLVRPSIRAPEGQTLVIADYSSIESVMVGWAAGEESILEVFRTGKDLYKSFAVKLFGVPYDQVTKQQRQFCKPAVLGAVYGLSANGLKAYAQGYGVELDDQEANRHIDVFRAAYPKIAAFWKRLEKAAKTCAEIPGATASIKPHFAFTSAKDGSWMSIALPSGRRIWYARPGYELVERKGVDGEVLSSWNSVCYDGMFTGAAGTGARKWGRISSHGGKWTENIVQAIARDVLVHGLLNAEAAPLITPFLHVHDEIVATAPADRADEALDQLLGCMTAPPWCADAPISAAGFTSQYYRKD